MQIAGSHALVTGGGSGVGRSIALALAAEGAIVTICGRRKDQLEAVANEAANIYPLIADVTDEESVAKLYADAEAARGPFDIVVANAGIAESAPAAKTTLDQWNRIMSVNLTGAFLTVRPALSGMAKRKAGRIIFVASIAGLKGGAYIAPYVASKHGVIGMMRSLAVEFARTGVTINAVCPGFVETDMLQKSVDNIVNLTGRSEAEARASLVAGNPQQRFIQPDEVADSVLWLCGEGARSINGQSISISGGETW